MPHTRSLAYYGSLVETALPSYGSNVLDVPSGSDWMAGMTVHHVAVAVLDSDPGTIVSSGPVVLGYDPPDGPRRIRLDFSEGYVRYTNRDRSFRTASPCVAVASSEADNALVATLGALGLPAGEWESRRIDLVAELGVSGEDPDPVETGCEIERMVTLTRKAANGLPVFDSIARETVSNLHERARLLIDWPRFVLQTGLLLRTQTEVVDDMARQIWEAERNADGLGPDVHLEIRIGYAVGSQGFVPVARGMFRDIYDRDAGEVLDVPLAYDPASSVPSEPLASLQFRARLDPAAGSALLEFSLPQAGSVRLSVMDVRGREVAVLANGPYGTGWHQVSWDLRDERGSKAASGVYFAVLRAGGVAPVKKLIVVQ